MNCSQCVSIHSLPLSEYLEIIKAKDPLHYCTIKKEHSTFKADSYCVNCKQWLCELCYNEHKSILKQRNDFIITKQLHVDNTCKAHPECLFKYYCKQCKIPLCKLCMKKYHSFHDVMDFDLITKEINDTNTKSIKQSFDDIILRNRSNKNVLIDCLEKEIDELIQLKHDLKDAYKKNKSNNKIIQELFGYVHLTFQLLNPLSVFELFMNRLNSFNVNENSMELEGDMKSNVKKCIEFFKANYIVKLKYDFKYESTIETDSESAKCLIRLNDGRLAIGSTDKTVKIINVNVNNKEEHKVEATLEGHQSSVYSLIQLTDGRLVSGSFKEIKIWNTLDWSCVSTLSLHTNSVFTLIQLTDSKLLSGSGDNTIRVWDTSSLECLSELKEHTDAVYCLIELADRRVASGSRDKSIKLWNIKEGKCVGTLLSGNSDAINVLLQLKDGKLVSGTCNSILMIWDINSMTQLEKIEGTNENTLSLLQIDNEKLLSGDRKIIMWKLNPTTSKIKQIKVGSNVRRLINLDDGRIASCSDDGLIRLWNI